MAEDDIDTEALQAQIDLSMSFTHELVSSWVKPSQKKSTSTYNQNLEAELKDYMRRPPRLGVGAAILESSSSLTRETARLKGQLVGKNKRSREDVGETRAHSDSGEDESKTSSVVRKKVKLDPFAGVHGKKKKQTTVDASTESAKSVVTKQKTPSDSPRTEDATKSEALKSKDGQPNRSNPFSLTKVRASTPTVTLNVATAEHDRQDEEKVSELLMRSPTASPAKPEPASPSSPKRSSSSTSRPPVSVLNLDGPVGDDSEDDDPQALASSPSKKKRKRRKKKKHALLAASTSEAS